MNLFVSYMRTIVPLIAGVVLGLGARAGLDLDGERVAVGVTAAATAGYYAVFRGVEQLAGRLRVGWLRTAAGVALGWARPPQYPAQGATTVRLSLDPVTTAEMIRRHLDRTQPPKTS